MTILSKLKNEYEESIKHLMNAALSLNKIMDKNEHIGFMLFKNKERVNLFVFSDFLIDSINLKQIIYRVFAF